MKASGLPIWLVLVLFIIFIALLNIPVGGAPTKYAVIAPIFVPMFMLLGIIRQCCKWPTELVTHAPNPITPTFAYFGMLLALGQKYDKRLRFGSLFANMTPYCIASGFVMTILLCYGLFSNFHLGRALVCIFKRRDFCGMYS